MTRIARLLAVSLFATTTLGGCAALPDGAAPVPDGGQVILGMGQSTLLADNSLLTYARLVNDSRCQPNVQCVWEGSAEIALRWQPRTGDARDLRLHTHARTGPTRVALGERGVVLVALERGITPKATLRIERNP